MSTPQVIRSVPKGDLSSTDRVTVAKAITEADAELAIAGELGDVTGHHCLS